jgi:hypothetical protein
MEKGRGKMEKGLCKLKDHTCYFLNLIFLFTSIHFTSSNYVV